MRTGETGLKRRLFAAFTKRQLAWMFHPLSSEETPLECGNDPLACGLRKFS